LVQTGELEVEINIPENKLSEIQIGTPCEISFWANNEKVAGVVREISPMADSVSKTYRVKISLQNLREEINLGMTASAIFRAKNSSSNAVILPLSAIYQTGENSQVWIVTAENKTALKNVIVQDFSNNEVLVNGLNAGEVVITAGVHKLREGQEIRIKD
jgi:RND family efflux transporter MFP subunit